MHQARELFVLSVLVAACSDAEPSAGTRPDLGGTAGAGGGGGTGAAGGATGGVAGASAGTAGSGGGSGVGAVGGSAGSAGSGGGPTCTRATEPRADVPRVT